MRIWYGFDANLVRSLNRTALVKNVVREVDNS
jgi:hypothetical protein